MRAENETRTRDPNLGKVVLYQLSYFRKCEEEETRTPTSQLTLPPQSSASTNSATSPGSHPLDILFSEGVNSLCLALWHRACFPFAIAKVLHVSELAKAWGKKNAFFRAFSCITGENLAIFCRYCGSNDAIRGMLLRKMLTNCKQNALSYTICGGSGLIPSKGISHFSGFRKVGDVFF